MTIVCSRCDGNHMRSECPTLADKAEPVADAELISDEMIRAGREADGLAACKEWCHLPGCPVEQK